MYKEIKTGTDARNGIKNGIDKLAEAVKATMGPKGRNVIIEQKDSLPHITKDGVTVARSINFKDKLENIGAQLLKEVATKTGNDSGDGTTTATVLAQSIFNEGLNSIKLGVNPILLKRSLDAKVKIIVDEIKNNAIPVADDVTKIKNVASISANNDFKIGEIIAEAITKVGTNGVISVEETTNTETTVGIVEGMQLDKGMLSHYFATNPETGECEFENCMILLYDKRINSIKDIYHILEMSVKEEVPILLIADDYEPALLSNLVANKLRGSLKVCAIKSPGFGESRREIMEDIAILTGGTFICEEFGTYLKSFKNTQFGFASKVTIGKDATLIVGGDGDKESIDLRINQLRSKIKNEQIEYKREIIQDRIAKLAGGVAVISVGATSEIEVKELKDRIDDALCATRSALEEGIVAGAGSTYLKCMQLLRTIGNTETEADKHAVSILNEALQQPFIQICKNAGIENYLDLIDHQIKNNFKEGFNLASNQFENLVETGVIDPAKVSRTAIENAVSIASIFLTTECVIIENE